VCIALLSTPFHVWATGEQLIAVVLVKDIPRYQNIHHVFAEEISLQSTAAYQLYVQSPNDDFMSLRNSVRKAVAINADLIVVYGTSAALAAQMETRHIPVLFADVYNPVAQGLVLANGQAEHDIMGVRGDGPLQTLINAYLNSTSAKKIAAIYNPKDPAGKTQINILKTMAGRKAFIAVPLAITTAEEVKTFLDKLPDDIDGLLVTDSTFFTPFLTELIEIANRNKMAVLTQIPDTAELGAFMVLEHDPFEQGKELAKMASMILSGTEISALNLMKPHHVHLTVNLKVAKELGITVPFDVLAMTSRVIR
jgi:putative ABC transport system substrate-binding protein